MEVHEYCTSRILQPSDWLCHLKDTHDPHNLQLQLGSQRLQHFDSPCECVMIAWLGHQEAIADMPFEMQAVIEAENKVHIMHSRICH